MSQAVDRLKELLFQPESEAIAGLAQRIDAVFDRAGTTERFQSSVATVLDGALRDAEVARHDQVASAIAPLIVKTVKTEIRNSTDDLVEALYPATGRMVRAYVASAIKDLSDDINRRLGSNPVMLRLNALTTGRSVGELAIAASQRLKVEDVLLIRRATGELVARATNDAIDRGSDHILGGVLTAINEFTTEAFKAEGSALRQIDLGESKVYLRVSPTYLLAAKCSGTAVPGTEQIFDDEFLSLIDRHYAALDQAAATDGNAPVAEPLMTGLSRQLSARLDEMAATLDALPQGLNPLRLLAGIVGIPLLAWIAWSTYVGFETAQVRGTATRVVAAAPAMRGYPTTIKVADGGHVLTISGLAPTSTIKSAVLDALRIALPGVDIHDQLSPVGSDDLTPLVASLMREREKEALQRNLQRAIGALDRAQQSLKIAATQGTPTDAGRAKAVATRVATLAQSLRADPTPARMNASTRDARALAADLGHWTEANQQGSASDDSQLSDDTGESLATYADRIAQEAKTITVVGAVRQDLETDRARLKAELAAIPRPRAPTPREELVAFGQANAIFFLEETAYRDGQSAERALDALAKILARDPSLLLRIVGYTDDAGSAAKNEALAQSRAATVAASLVARGVPPRQLVAIRRLSSDYRVSLAVGPGSPNRRVEFEVGFTGEGTP